MSETILNIEQQQELSYEDWREYAEDKQCCSECGWVLQEGDPIHELERESLIHVDCLEAIRVGDRYRQYGTNTRTDREHKDNDRLLEVQGDNVKKSVEIFSRKHGVIYKFQGHGPLKEDIHDPDGPMFRGWYWDRTGLVDGWEPVKTGVFHDGGLVEEAVAV